MSHAVRRVLLALLLGSRERVEMHARLLEEEAALEADAARAETLRALVP